MRLKRTDTELNAAASRMNPDGDNEPAEDSTEAIAARIQRGKEHSGSKKAGLRMQLELLVTHFKGAVGVVMVYVMEGRALKAIRELRIVGKSLLYCSHGDCNKQCHDMSLVPPIHIVAFLFTPHLAASRSCSVCSRMVRRISCHFRI